MLSLAYCDAAEHHGPGAPAPHGGAGASGPAGQLARQAVAERQRLADFEAALNRIATGKYGWCEQCRRPISAVLLATRPQARFCAACARSVRAGCAS
jgi:hypothetical protein